MKRVKKEISKFKGLYKKDKRYKVLSIFIALGIVLILLLYFAKSYILVATVDGYPITRYSVVKELEKQGGQQVLDSLVTRALIINKASDEGISIDQVDVEKEIKTLEEQLTTQGLTLDQALEMQGQTRDDLNESIRMQMIVEKLLGSDIEVTDEAVSDYFSENEEFYADSTLDEVSESIRQQLYQQQLSQKYQEWLENLRSEASIKYILEY
jgi:foldase protein PrsA